MPLSHDGSTSRVHIELMRLASDGVALRMLRHGLLPNAELLLRQSLLGQLQARFRDHLKERFQEYIGISGSS